MQGLTSYILRETKVKAPVELVFGKKVCYELQKGKKVLITSGRTYPERLQKVLSVRVP